jgi:hypothetical protein
MLKYLVCSGVCAAVAMLIVGCSGGDSSSDSVAGVGSSGGSSGNTGINLNGGATSGGKSGSSGSGSNHVGPNDCPITIDNSGCAGELYVGENIPLDIYIMFDQSGSMTNPVEGGMTRMDAVRNALNQFLLAPESAGIGVGIGYFGTQPLGSTSCDPANYATPDKVIGQLPDYAPELSASLAAREPTGETPTESAIVAACSYAQNHKRTVVGHEVVILLVTDGIPMAPVTCRDGSGPCCPTLEKANAAAAACLTSKPGVKTYVLGVGPALDNLQQLAVAGGTKQAYLVGDEDVTENVLAALNAIRADATIPCELEIPPPPPGDVLDFDRVNVVHTTNTCETNVLFFREEAAQCDPSSGGWYYQKDASGNRTGIELCGKSCQDVSIPGGQLLFSIGCDQQVEIR